MSRLCQSKKNKKKRNKKTTTTNKIKKKRNKTTTTTTTTTTTKETKNTHPPLALFRLSYRYRFPFVNILLLSYCCCFAYFKLNVSSFVYTSF